jgi:tetratricopeptide (TPR) repeat protein
MNAARADVAAAQFAYAAGAYDEAARQGEEVGDSPSFALAARALLAESILSVRAVPEEVLTRAVQDAQRALDLDSKSIDARLDLALALGMQGQRVSLGEAWRRGYAQRGRHLIEEAIALSPNEPRALCLLGGWHLEVLRRAGGAGALFLGARFDRGVAAFEKARAAAPNDPLIALHYAVALLGLDPRKHGALAADLLAAAAAVTPTDSFESGVREEARRLGAVLATSGALAAAQAVNERFL